MEENKNTDVIDLRQIAKKIRQQRKVFYKVWLITIVLSSLIIICIPRYYVTTAKLAPEIGNASSTGLLGSIATSFGINLDNSESADAINPMLYPDLMDDDGFVASLFSIHVKSADGEIDTDYYTYLKSYQKRAWWSNVISVLSNRIKSIFPKKEKTGAGDGKMNPYWMSEADFNRAEIIRNNIHFNINEKNGTISITTKAQDPLIAKILTDSVQVRLQEFIISYRTNKSRVDVEHYEKLTDESRKAYDLARDRYSRYNDANKSVVLPSINTKLEDLAKDMQLKYNTFTTMTAQLELAKAKLQERTPAFTTLKAASVPIKPAGPKRMLFVLFMVVFATVTTGVVILREDLLKLIVISGTDKSK